MKAYAMVKACLRADRPFSCYKYVIDLADENATAHWRYNVAKGASLFVAALADGTL